MVKRLWDGLAGRLGGKRMFSYLLRWIVPYTGTVRPQVEELRDGFARIRMRERRAVRNHLRSVHAVAIANIAELASGLALAYSLPPDARAILTSIEITYLKKARGTLVAEATVDIPRTNERQEREFVSEVRDGAGELVARAVAGELVARAVARWMIGPRD